MNGWGETKLASVKVGDRFEVDDAFTCKSEGDIVTIERDEAGLFFKCDDGQHFIEGQEDEDGLLIGVRAVRFTPPPWVVVPHMAGEPEELDEYRIHYDDSGCWLATVHIGAPPDADEIAEALATAALISAAPELLATARNGLAALESELELILESHCKLGADLNPIRDTLDEEVRETVSALETKIAQARAAIAKATGAA